ncbi:hypothetical protein E3P89_01330 [Wallemia ichthyophaga]|uniref:NmrA-like domain-containing protein n=1 Tax=Wallemia ichthyophaga TaxID=245174 RepID=A0A4T0JFQ4_WALIC|nr:hypothetical protein E3P90_01730 [Wallemia ichthyophaga]TIB15013.1 hypothetical protein E3P93_01480 [Wallemia ichthyophaga]TIB23909.1 hypothetical protein E3P89_01330 [Wallemia ichthyophaga]TIB25364.1 hypothetical protein E3P88_01685 [Wallemia ichthyophaga]TIB34676.1 hypothetical protein E3P84_01685 [Wallemia ichthyophaga]
MYLITGATGQQGNATIQHLKGEKTRALVRNPASEAAKKLEGEGVDIAKGDLTDSLTIYNAMEGCKAAFLVTTMAPNGPSDEVIQGKAFIDAAKKRNIRVVYTSVDSAKGSNVPHFESKAEVEQMIRDSNLPHTIVKPVAFMDNFPKKSGLQSFLTIGLFSAAILDKKIQLVAVDDIGRVAATALKHPERYNGRSIPLAGEELSISDIQNAYNTAHGAPAWKAYLPSFTPSLLSNDFSKMFYWFRSDGYKANIPALREEFPAIAAAAAVKRQQEVGSIEIQDAVASNMTMNLVTSDDTSIPIGLNNGVLTTGQDPITVNFLPVNSQYMEYDNDNDDNEKFGHLVNSETQESMTVQSPGVSLGQNVYLMESMTADNSSQMLQFWKLNTESMEVEFLGRPDDADFGEGPLTPQSQNEGDGNAIGLYEDTDAVFVLQEQQE